MVSYTLEEAQMLVLLPRVSSKLTAGDYGNQLVTKLMVLTGGCQQVSTCY